MCTVMLVGRAHAQVHRTVRGVCICLQLQGGGFDEDEDERPLSMKSVVNVDVAALQETVRAAALSFFSSPFFFLRCAFFLANL